MHTKQWGNVLFNWLVRFQFGNWYICVVYGMNVKNTDSQVIKHSQDCTDRKDKNEYKLSSTLLLG